LQQGVTNKSVNIFYIETGDKACAPPSQASDPQHGPIGAGSRDCHDGNLIFGLSLLWRWLVNKLTLVAALAALTALSACKKTGEGQYEVQKPVVGTETDTVNTPSIETGTVKDTITVPTVGTEKKEVNLPKVEVNKPKE
jgi:hypothetical protein